MISTAQRTLRPACQTHGYQLLGQTIVSDYSFQSLHDADPATAVTSVLAMNGDLPPPGALLTAFDVAGTSITIRVSEGPSGIRYDATTIGSFWIGPAGTAVWYRLEAGAQPCDVESILVGPVLALAMQSQGQVHLHASAVVVDGQAVAFSAPSGAGKSTLAAAWVQAGYPLLTDDVLPLLLDGAGVVALHSLPRLKLWGDSLTALGRDESLYPRNLSFMAKRQIMIGREWGTVAPDSAPLGVIYLLAPHTDAGREIEFQSIAPLDRTLRLLGSLYLGETLRGARAVRALDAVTRIASVTPVRRAVYCRTYTGLAALQRAILADLPGVSS